jgi:hypothetical protein
MGAAVNVSELEARIVELEAQVRGKDEEIMRLRSHLDKYQSVFPYYMAANNNNSSPNNNNTGPELSSLRPRKRAEGISAEPIQELSQQKFPTYPKNDG